MAIRAKLRCQSVKTFVAPPTGGPARSYEFQAMYDTSIPEDQRFSLATPSAQLTMYVDNPAVSFEPGKDYYIDFTPVD